MNKTSYVSYEKYDNVETGVSSKLMIPAHLSGNVLFKKTFWEKSYENKFLKKLKKSFKKI